MEIFGDFHTHTIFSHGTGTVEANVKAAITRGLKAIAITDHDSTHMFYGIRKRNEYLDEIKRCQDVYGDRIKILAGVEANITSVVGGQQNKLSKFDFIVLGYHKAVFYRNMTSAWHFYINNLSAKDKIKAIRANTRAYIAAINAIEIDILAHPNYGVPCDWLAIAAECAKTGTAIEINNANIVLTVEDYDALKETNVRFAVSSDAHCPEKVGVFDNALAFIKKTNINSDDIVNAR